MDDPITDQLLEELQAKRLVLVDRASAEVGEKFVKVSFEHADPDPCPAHWTTSLGRPTKIPYDGPQHGPTCFRYRPPRVPYEPGWAEAKGYVVSGGEVLCPMLKLEPVYEHPDDDEPRYRQVACCSPLHVEWTCSTELSGEPTALDNDYDPPGSYASWKVLCIEDGHVLATAYDEGNGPLPRFFIPERHMPPAPRQVLPEVAP